MNANVTHPVPEMKLINFIDLVAGLFLFLYVMHSILDGGNRGDATAGGALIGAMVIGYLVSWRGWSLCYSVKTAVFARAAGITGGLIAGGIIGYFAYEVGSPVAAGAIVGLAVAGPVVVAMHYAGWSAAGLGSVNGVAGIITGIITGIIAGGAAGGVIGGAIGYVGPPAGAAWAIAGAGVGAFVVALVVAIRYASWDSRFGFVGGLAGIIAGAIAGGATGGAIGGAIGYIAYQVGLLIG